MSSFLSKKIITVLVLTSFLTVAIFSFAVMTRGPDGRMEGDCPFSVVGQSICPQDTVAVAIHHISAYQSFLNMPVGSGLTALIVSLLFAVCAALFILISSPLLGPPAVARILYDSPSIGLRSRKLTRWLSLFENSPSMN
ncbi:MAG: hypothetical protein AAB470_01890 [Patescibacteria group bacterium]